MDASADQPDSVELNEVLPALAVPYGAEVAFAEGRALRFPDFELMFRGRATHPANEGQTWVFRLRDDEGDREVLISSGGALAEPGASWVSNGEQFEMNWVRRTDTTLREIVVTPKSSA